VLDTLGHRNTHTDGIVSYATLRDETATGRPLFLRIQWSGGGRHAVLATGVEDGGNVIVCDPGASSAADASLGTTSVWDYDVLQTAYNTTGSWIATATTEP
jgi:hypothetical protein